MIITAQRIGVEYRTAINSINTLHFITFNKDSTVNIRFPNHPGFNIFDPNEVKAIWYYIKKGDTIKIKTNDPIDMAKENVVIQRIMRAAFITTSNKSLVDQISGFTYVLKRLTRNNKYGAFAIDGRIYLIKKRNPSALKKKIKHLQSDHFTNNFLRGKAAYDKYGIKGINGVIEIEKK